jgi:hypothetical protein
MKNVICSGSADFPVGFSACEFGLSITPKRAMYVRRMLMNIHSPMVVYVSSEQFDRTDAWLFSRREPVNLATVIDLSSVEIGLPIDFHLRAGETFKMKCEHTGFSPAPLCAGMGFQLSVVLLGQVE